VPRVFDTALSDELIATFTIAIKVRETFRVDPSRSWLMINLAKCALAATVASVGMAAVPGAATATFPGSNGQIAVTVTVYDSCRDNDEECSQDSFLALGEASGSGLLRRLSCDRPCGARALASSADGRGSRSNAMGCWAS
jgi:hypothetical protein